MPVWRLSSMPCKALSEETGIRSKRLWSHEEFNNLRRDNVWNFGVSTAKFTNYPLA